jgi:hypothetical protein
MVRLNIKSIFIKFVLLIILFCVFKLTKNINKFGLGLISKDQNNYSNLNTKTSFKYNYFYYNITINDKKTVNRNLSKYVIIDKFDYFQNKNHTSDTTICKFGLNKTNATSNLLQIKIYFY